MADDTADRIAAALAGIRRDVAKAVAAYALDSASSFADLSGQPAVTAWHARSLLAAVEAALKLADDWDAEARGIFLEAGRTCDAGEVGAASALQSAAADLRAAITAELAGEAGDA